MRNKLNNRYIRALAIYIGVECFVLISEWILSALSVRLEWSDDAFSLAKKIRALFCYPVISYIGYLMIKGNGSKRARDQIIAMFGWMVSISGVMAVFRTIWGIASQCLK